MAFAHHDAAFDHQRSGGEAEFIRAQQRADHHIATGFHLAVGLHADTATQAVQHQRLLGFGQPQFHGAGMFDRRPRRCAGAAIMAGDHDDRPWPWPTPAATVPTPTSDTSLTDTSAFG